MATDPASWSWRNSALRYGWTSQLLHWMVAVLIVTQFVIANLAEAAADDGSLLGQLKHLARHKSIGITILFLALVRLGWRFYSPPPAHPPGMSGWQVWGARLVHWALYALLFALPLSGWLMSSAANFPVSYFGLFTLPDLVGPSAGWQERWEDIHHLLGNVLVAMAALHIVAALWHHFFAHDNVLRRMLPLKLRAPRDSAS